MCEIKRHVMAGERHGLGMGKHAMCELAFNLPVRPVWPIVLQRKMLFHISVQCLTATQLLPHLSTRKPKVLFCDFPTCRPANLPVHCWYYSLQKDAWLPTVLTQPSFISLSAL